VSNRFPEVRTVIGSACTLSAAAAKAAKVRRKSFFIVVCLMTF
jgi:hypothetical protein